MKIKPVAPKAGFKALIEGLYILLIKSCSTVTLVPKSVVPWTDATVEHKITLEDMNGSGSVIHQFHEDGYISAADYEPKGILHGQQIPKGCEFLSSDNSAGNEEQYLCRKVDGEWQRIKHDVSRVSIAGKESVMKDDKIDAMLDNGEDITIVTESKSRIAKRMFNEFAFLSGLRAEDFDREITFEDFAGLAIGAKVGVKTYGADDKEFSFVKKFYSAEAMEAELAKIDA